MKAIVNFLKSLSILSIFLIAMSCNNQSPESQSNGSSQDTSMPNQQNDGYPHTNPTTRSDTSNSHVDTTVQH